MSDYDRGQIAMRDGIVAVMRDLVTETARIGRPAFAEAIGILADTIQRLEPRQDPMIVSGAVRYLEGLGVNGPTDGPTNA